MSSGNKPLPDPVNVYAGVCRHISSLNHNELNVSSLIGVTHIWVSKITIIGSDNGFSPKRHSALIWNCAWILLTGTLGPQLNWNVMCMMADCQCEVYWFLIIGSNSVKIGDLISIQRYWPTTACYRKAPSHFLNQFWFKIIGNHLVQCHGVKTHYLKSNVYKLSAREQQINWLTFNSLCPGRFDNDLENKTSSSNSSQVIAYEYSLKLHCKVCRITLFNIGSGYDQATMS